jgi:hypothetical protein
MSRNSEDERAVHELSRMAEMYSQRGMTEQANEIKSLIDAILVRMRKESRQNPPNNKSSAS